MKTIKLKNGKEELKAGVQAIMVSLRDLFERDPIAFYELNELCKNRDHKLFCDAEKLGEMVQKRGDGSVVHETIRNVVLSCVQGAGLDMTIGSPIAG